MSGRNLVEVMSMTAIVTTSCIKVYPDKGFLSAIYSVVIKYLPCSNAGVNSKVRRASHKSYTEEGHFTPGQNGRPDSEHSRPGHSRQVAFNLNPFQHCPDVQAARMNLMHRFHLWFFLVCSTTDSGECLCVGDLSCTHNLKACAVPYMHIVYAGTI